MNLQFTIASPSQHMAIEQLMRQTFEPYVHKLGGGDTAGSYPWLETAINVGNVYLALDKNEIVGIVAVSIHGEELSIDQICVAATRQGSGIGSWLLEQIEATAREKGITVLSLFTAEIMTDLLRLYERHGFVETARALPDHGEDNYLRIHMKKFL